MPGSNSTAPCSKGEGLFSRNKSKIIRLFVDFPRKKSDIYIIERMTRSKNSRGIKTMNIGQKQIAGVMARAKRMGRPRIGSWRCSATIPDHITEGIDAHRRLTNLSRTETLIALIDAGLRSQTCHPAIIDRQGAIALLRSSVTMRLKATDDPEVKRVAMNTLLHIDWIEEYLGLANEGAK